MTTANLQPFLRPNLDVLFVALNPARQSNENGHYFSGKHSRFFKLLFESGLTSSLVPKATGDEIVFGSTHENFQGKSFGIIDLVPDLVETNSARVKPTGAHVAALLENIRRVRPRFVCIIHYKVRKALALHGQLMGPLHYGHCGSVLPDSPAIVVMNYFPNGNATPDQVKLQIFHALRGAL